MITQKCSDKMHLLFTYVNIHKKRVNQMGFKLKRIRVRTNVFQVLYATITIR